MDLADSNIRLSTRSQYFNVVCNGSFAVRDPCSSNQALTATDIPKESKKRFIELPERGRIVETMLRELYEVYNSSTGSIFTGFALCSMAEKDLIMTELLALFVACDKVNSPHNLYRV